MCAQRGGEEKAKDRIVCHNFLCNIEKMEMKGTKLIAGLLNLLLKKIPFFPHFFWWKNTQFSTIITISVPNSDHNNCKMPEVYSGKM